MIGGILLGVDGVILAAGLSSRAGKFKMTLNFNDKTVIENVIEPMEDFCENIILVGGYRIEELKNAANRYDNVRLVFNENFLEGMFSSVRCGISHVKEDKFFLTPGDYPLISRDVYEALLNDNSMVSIPVYKGMRGHPVLFNSSSVDEILDGDWKSLREYVNSKNPSLVEVDSPSVISDIDTMDDYKRLLNLGRR